MMSEISEVYSGLADDVRPEDIVVGTPLCALYGEDGLWYRAVIESVPSEFEVAVRYIDYGNSDVVLLSDVRQLSKRFFDLPVQAVRCCLPSLEEVDSFQQRVDGKELNATFLSLENGTWQVSLSDGVERMPEDVAEVVKISEYLKPAVMGEMRDRVYVSHVVSPDEFYVQFESSLDELSLLSVQISQFYSSMAPSNYALNNPCAGMSCCARFSQDGDWYRGKITGVASSGAKVEFVDYGNGEVVPFHDIKDTDKKFMQLPQQAILCGLDATKDIWTAQEVNIFKSVALDKSFDATFIIRDGQKWRLCLESGGVSVVDMFMNKDTATHKKAGSEVSSIQTKSYVEQTLSSGQIEEVFVSHVTESGDFYIQLSKTSADLGTIEFLVSEFYDQLGLTDEVLEMCFVDSLCCAKFSQDLKWYRALITKVFSDKEVEVLFVDYGNIDSVKVETVKQIKPELLTFPVQAVKCRLEGSKEVWTESDVEQFEASVIDKPLHVTFTRQEGDKWFVTIQELDMFATKECPKVKSFSKEVFDFSKRENAFFVYADSHDCIWLQPERTGNALIELMDQIANDITGQPMHKSQMIPTVPCLAKFMENDMWHRAQILDVLDNGNVTVFYVDYGSSETLPMDRLHPISDAHFKLPAQAIRCQLADVQGVDPNKITEYLNEVLFEKVVEVEVQQQHPDSFCTVKLYDAGAEQSINEQLVGECLGDTSLLEETNLEQATPPRLGSAQEKRAFKLPELMPGGKVPVSFISAFLPAEMQLLLTDRTDKRDQLSNNMTSMYEALDDSELKFENPVVGDLCCVHFSPEQDGNKKWCRGEIISISADETVTVKLVDYGTHEKIPISGLKSLKDELLDTPVFVLESSLANIHPSSGDCQWSPECSTVLESLCRSKALVAEITQVTGSFVELVLYDGSEKSVNQNLIDLGYAKASEIEEDFSGEQLCLKWPAFQVGQCTEVYLMAVKDLQSMQLQLADSEADLTKMREQLTSVYSTLGEAEEVLGNPRVGQVCCAQFAEDEEWYRAAVTCVSDAGVEVKFVDYGNMDTALSVKRLREDFYVLPVQCFKCSLHGVVPAAETSATEVAARLLELCDGKRLTAETTSVTGDSVVVNLFDKSGEAKESVADILVKLGNAVSQPTPQEGPRRVSLSEDGKIVYKYPEYGVAYGVNLMSVNSPSDFWCQLKDSKAELTLLSETTDLFYQNLGENDLRLWCLQAGDICCAKFSDDDRWYRSQVSEVHSEGQACVRSVDYSKQETLTLDRIKKLEAQFAVLPVQTINCGLADVEPPHKYYGEEWSSQAVVRFKELCDEKDLKIKGKGTDGNLTFVELIDSTGLSVADKLLSEGLAVETKSPLTVSPIKDPQKQSVSSPADQVDKALEQSSEEDVFQEAESGLEGVDEVAKEKDHEEEEEEEEEEFHDSNDQVGSEASSDEKKVLLGIESDQGVPETTESALEGEEVQEPQETELQDVEKKEGGDERGLVQITEEVLEEKPGPEVNKQQEEDDKKEEITEEVDSEETKAQGIEILGVTEEIESKVDKNMEVADTSQTAGLSEKTEELGERELETEERLITASMPEQKDDREEESEMDSSETAREEQELKTEVASAVYVPEEAKEREEKETTDVDSSREKQEEYEEGSVNAAITEQEGDGVEKEMTNADSPDTGRGEQEELTIEGSATSNIPEQKEEKVDKETDDADSSESAAEEEQEEPRLEKIAAIAVGPEVIEGTEGVEEQGDKYRELQGDVTEAFSEEDLTGMHPEIDLSSQAMQYN